MTSDLHELRALAARWLRAQAEWEEQPRTFAPAQLRYIADLLDGAGERRIVRGPLALETPATTARVLPFPVHRARTRGGAA